MANDRRPGTEPRRSWRGERRAAETVKPHRWQMTEQELRQTQGTADGDSQRFRYLLLLASAVTLLGIYLALVLLSPARTPMLILTESAYPAQFPANPFAEEDAERLEWLDEKNLSVYRENSILNIEAGLDRIESEVYRNRTLLLYVSAHGAVDDDGRPCLIPATASPIDPKTWVPLEKLLGSIGRRPFARTCAVVLFLDCQKFLFEPRLGTLRNRFVEAIREKQLVRRKDLPRLAIICSSGAEEVSQTIARGRNSLFADAVAKALSGMPYSSERHWFSNRIVSLGECFAELQQSVASQAERQSNRSQTPVIFASNQELNSRDAPLTYALRETMPEPTPALRPDRTDLNELWSALEQLDTDAYRDTHPEQLARLEQLLLRLEEWRTSGTAYADRAASLTTLLKQKLGRLRDIATQSETFLTRDELQAGPDDLHTLALSRALAGRTDETFLALSASLERAQQEPARSSFESARDDWIRSGRVPAAPLFHFVDLLLHDAASPVWNDVPALRGLLESESAARRIPGLGDLASFSAYRQEIETADQVRRSAEDLIYEGTSASRQQLIENSKSARRQYERIADRLEHHQQVLRLCNRIDAELSWMWDILVRLEADPGAREAVESFFTLDDLISLHNEVSDLRTALDGGPVDDELRGQLQTHYESRQKQLLQFFAALEDPENRTLETIHLIDCCLKCPLVPAQARANMAKARLDILGELHQKAERSLAQRKTYSPPAGQPPNASEAQTPQQKATVDGILQLIDADTAESADAEKVLRSELRSRYDFARRLSAAERTAEFANLAVNLPERARRSRQVAAWNPGRIPASSNDQKPSDTNASLLAVDSPTAILLRLQLEQLLLLEADRILEDAWGIDAFDTRDYFESAGRRLLGSARKVSPRLPQPGDDVDRRLTLVSQKSDLLHRGLQAESDDVYAIAPELEGQVHLRIRTVESNSANAPSAIWPQGRATLMLENSSGRCSQNDVLFDLSALNNAGSTVAVPEPLLFSSRGYFDGERELRAHIAWRGHHYRSGLPFAIVEGGRTHAAAGDPAATTLNVVADVPPPADFLFILDVSQSMGKKTLDDPNRTRWEVAAGVLTDALRPLVGQAHIRIGVLAYGHRAGWNTKNPDQILYQPKLQERIPTGLLPLEDVEVLLSPGPLTTQAAAELQQKLARMIPWGETPLYLALNEAAKLAPEMQTDQTHIVVLTDGVNRQRIPDGLILSEQQQSHVVTAEQLEATLRSRNVHVSVLGFELSEQQDVDKQVELRQLVDRVGGDYFPAVQANALYPLIQKLLGPREYSVIRNLQQVATHPLGEQVDLKGVGNVQVSVDAATTRLSTDERRSVQLYYGAQRLATKPFLTDLAEKTTVPAGCNPPQAALWLGVHQPRFQSPRRQDVSFSLSLQTDAADFVSRPNLILVRATALAADRAAPLHEWYYYQPATRTDFTVPLWELQAENWPAEANRLRLDVFLSWNPLAFEETSAPLAELLQRSLQSGSTDRQTIARMPSNRSTTIDLFEKRDPAADSWPAMFELTCTSKSIARQQVRHVFDREHGAHLQQFTLESDDEIQPDDWTVKTVAPGTADALEPLRLKSVELPVLPSGDFLRSAKAPRPK